MSPDTELVGLPTVVLPSGARVAPVLPASAAYPVGQLISAGGQPVTGELVMVAADTGLPWRLVVAGSPAALTLNAIPSVADVAAGFATAADLAAATTVNGLLSWGF